MTAVAEPISELRLNISRAEYEAIPAANVSMLEKFERSAAHAREAILHPSAPTPAMDFGTAAHCAILEPARFAKEYVAAPQCDRRTKDGKQRWAEFEAEHPGATALDAEDFIALSRMRDSVWQHQIAQQMLRGLTALSEVAVVWRDAETELACKGLIDRIGTFDGWTWIVDLKTTTDARRRAFARQIRDYNYGAKAAFYVDGCNVVAPRERRFAWIAVEKTPPYAVAIYEAFDTALDAGRNKYRRWLRSYADAVATDTWPAYEANIEPLSNEETEWYS